VLLNTLYERAVALGVKVYTEYIVFTLAVDEGRCHGIIALDQSNGKLVQLGAKARSLPQAGMGVSTSIPRTRS